MEDHLADHVPKIVRTYVELRDRKVTLLIAGKEDREENEWLKGFLEEVDDLIKGEKVAWGYVPFKNLEPILGTTWDLLIVDHRKDFRPNDLGRVTEVVRGGGLMIMIIPRREEWVNMVTPFQRDLIVSPFTEKDLRRIFIKYVIDSLETSLGVLFLTEEGKLIGIDRDVYIPEKAEKRFYSDFTFRETVFKICASQDQIDALYAIDKVSRSKGSVVITSDRGRGKSAVLGLGIAGILLRDGAKDRKYIILTSPEPENVKEVFNFVARGLHNSKVEFEVKRKHDAIVGLSCEYGDVKYVNPIEVFKEEPDYLFVDEASGLPINILEGYVKEFETTVFAATLHGYEGAGRGFQVRFLPMLRRLKGENLIEIHMTEPIRYAEMDPVEEWLYKTLFLDSDPAEISEEELVNLNLQNLRYVKIDLRDWIYNKRDKMKEFIGIYIYAHYRNRPNDIMILCDAPHHFARCLMYNDKVVNSLHLCFEGLMPEEDVRRCLSGNPPSGHLIPATLVRYYPTLRKVAELRGIRIVRIATHPDLMNKGIGSKALEEVTKEAKEYGVDWIGAGFGATYELLRFWVKNGFVPVYIGPVKNPASGEFSTIVIKPLSKEAIDVVKKLRVEFKRLFLETLVESHFVLDERIAHVLLSADRWPIHYKPVLSEIQKERLKGYALGSLHFGAAYDAIREIVKTHFMLNPSRRIPIPLKYEYALIAKVLQAKSWEKVSRSFDIDREELIEKIKDFVNKMRLHYVESKET